MSSTRQCGDCAFSDSRNSRAEPNVVVSNHEAESSRLSAFRTDASSSTTATRGGAFPIAPDLSLPAICVQLSQRPTPWRNFSARRSDPGTFGKAYEFGEAPHLHFGHHTPAVDLDRLLDGAERRCNLLIEAAKH